MEANITPINRKAILEHHRRAKMATSAHAYVRGNAAQFYKWLGSKSIQAFVPAGPDIWICGDCHTGNLGPVADVEGNIDIQIRDLDQTVIGNPAHDLLRLGLSLAMAARSSDLPGVTTALMLEEMIGGYLSGLTGRTPRVEPKDIEPIRRVMRQANKRQWKNLAEERIEDVKPNIPLGPKFWKLGVKESKELQRLFDEHGLHQLIQTITGHEEPKAVRLFDSAYWMKGCSSLGRLRYAVLVGVGEKKRHRYRLLDVKEAVTAEAPHSKSARMPANNAERVVAGARNLSPFLGNRMIASKISGRQVVIRELRPQDLKFELTGLLRAEAIAIARLMAGVVGRAHGRQLKTPERLTWAKELKGRNRKGLDAPRWLWGGVLELSSLHEAAYLEHCRRYALG